MKQGATGAALRDVNRSAVLRLIGGSGPISRADIARRLGISAATVTTQVRTLVDSGLVAPVEIAESAGGRPAELVGIVGTAAVAIGAKVAHDHLAVVEADLDGHILRSTSAPFDAFVDNPFTVITDTLEPIVRSASQGQVLLGLGLGIPGFEDPYGSGIVQAPFYGWRHLPLGEHLGRTLGIPVLVDNDVNTLAIAESLYGDGRQLANFVTVTLGRGIGMGIVVEGELYRGARGAAGEFGHVDVGGDAQCVCGKRGCLETVAAEPALLAAARRRRLLPKDAAPSDLVELARRGSRAALAIYEDAGAALGRALGAVSVVLDPAAIVLSGEGSSAWEYMAPGFRTAFDAGVFPASRGTIPVHVRPWDDATWALGAASLVLRAPFATPMQDHPAIDAIRHRLDVGFQSAGVR